MRTDQVMPDAASDATSNWRSRCARTTIAMVAGLLATALPAWAQPPPEAVEYYATDAVGSVRVVFDGAGNVLARSSYLPFGEALTESGPLPRQRFTGQERDGEAGLDYFNARSMQPRTGRFGRPDPLFVGALHNPQRWSRYNYARNNPLSLVDPTGAAELRINETVTVIGYINNLLTSNRGASTPGLPDEGEIDGWFDDSSPYEPGETEMTPKTR